MMPPHGRAPRARSTSASPRPGRARDGLHELVSLIEPLSLADELELGPALGPRATRVECPGVDGPNLAATALARFRDATGWDGPPVASAHRQATARSPPGMGGGSSDAAATLRLAARAARASAPISAGDRPRLGADVPALHAQPSPALVAGTGAAGPCRSTALCAARRASCCRSRPRG